MIEQHSILGEELVGFVHHLTAVGTIIRSHHERFDGLGYPDKLAGEAIPWLGRILAVAVRFTEINRMNKVSLEIIKQESGSSFDPEAVRLFLRCLPKVTVPRKEREVMLMELQPGMILAKGIYTPNGMLLIPEGQIMNEPFINKLHNHNRVSPIKQSLLVYL